MRFLRHSGLASAAISITFVAYLAALLSNWFRYELSLEAEVVLVKTTTVLVLVVAPSVILAIWKRDTTLWPAIAPLAMVLLVFTAIRWHERAFGSWLPSFYLNDVVSNDFQGLQTSRGLMEYKLELVNPFCPSHREQLLLRGPAGQFRIPFALFKDQPAGFAYSNDGQDWCTLERAEGEKTLRLRVSSLLKEGDFRVDLAARRIEPERRSSADPR
jgi:hypothetical protein